MIIFPAIDIKNGKAVRLLQGRAEDVTVFNENPVEAALNWQAKGASWLHLVDLDGAFSGTGVSIEIIKNIVEQTGLYVQVGGGMRSIEAVEQMLKIGVQKVIIGTAAYTQPKFLAECIQKFGTECIVCGIDASNGKVAIKGWVESTDITPIDLALRAKADGVKTIVYTDISKDGMLTGPNFEATKLLIDKTGLNIIASGGISSLENLKKCKEMGAYGAILGKAIYTGAIDLKDALSI